MKFCVMAIGRDHITLGPMLCDKDTVICLDLKLDEAELLEHDLSLAIAESRRIPVQLDAG